MGDNLIAGWHFLRREAGFHIHREHHCLRTERKRRLGDHLWPADRRRVEIDLLCSGVQHATAVFDGSKATSNGKGDEHLCRDCLYDVDQDAPAVT